MPRFLNACAALLLTGGLLLRSAAPAYGRYALEDFNFDGVTNMEFAVGLGLVLLAVLVGALGLPALLGWATYRWLLKRHPQYAARALPSLALACLASWVGPLWLSGAVGSGYLAGCCGLAWPVVGAALGYYAARKPLAAASQPEEAESTQG